MVDWVWMGGGEGDEVGEGADGIESAFEGGVRGDGGLEADFSTNSSAHGSLERYQLAKVRRRNRSLSSSIILTLGTLGHAQTGRALGIDVFQNAVKDALPKGITSVECKIRHERGKGKGVTEKQRKERRVRVGERKEVSY